MTMQVATSQKECDEVQGTRRIESYDRNILHNLCFVLQAHINSKTTSNNDSIDASRLILSVLSQYNCR